MLDVPPCAVVRSTLHADTDAAVGTIGEEQRLAPIVVQFVGALLDTHDLLGDQVELACVLADVAEQRHRALHQLCGGERVVAHLAHLTLEAPHLE